MHQILIFPLSSTEQIVWLSHSDTLNTITRCSLFMIVLVVADSQQTILSCSGSHLVFLQKQVQAFLDNKMTVVNYQNRLILQRQNQQNILTLMSDSSSYTFDLTDDQVLVLVKQLELLSIVMLENENEKQERGTRCC